jgi:hypothetical protein
MKDNGLIEGGFLSTGPLYTLLAMYMPLSVLLALLFLARTLAPMELPLASIIASSCVSAVIASLYCDFMMNVKSRLLADIRGAIIISGVIYALVSVFRRELPFGWRFRPGIANVLSVIGALHAWYSVISLKQVFSARRHLEIYTELYREDQLQSVLREDSSLLQDIDERITKRRRSYIAQLVIIGILTIINVIMKIPLSLSLYLLLIGILIGGVFICGFFGIMRREQRNAVEGIALSGADRLKHTEGMWILILFCTVCSILAASNTSLLPFSALLSFFAWLFSLFSGLSSPSARTFEPEFLETMELPSFIPPPIEDEPGLFPNWLVEYGAMIIKYSLIFLAVAAFIRFMISPLLNRGKPPSENLKFRQRLWRIIAEWFKGMLTALYSFYVFLKNNKTSRKLNKYNSEEIRRTAATILNAYSQAKKQDMRRSVTLFARLIIWGSEICHVDWKPSYAPGEYCGILVASTAATTTLDLIRQKIIRCGELFEQALYSAEVLSTAEQREFKNLVEEITATDS